MSFIWNLGARGIRPMPLSLCYPFSLNPQEKQNMIRLRLAIVAASVALSLAPVPALAQGGLTGNWELTLTTPQGSNTVALSLKQEVDKVTGDLNTPMGSLPV